QPRLEGEDGPQAVVVVPPPAEVLRPGPADGVGVDEALATEALGGEQVLGPGPQRPPQPGGDRRVEADLRPVDQLGGDVAGEDLAQPPLTLPAAYAVAD